MGRLVTCVRCGAQYHPMTEHLCADVKRRYDHRRRQADAVEAILVGRWPLIGSHREVAEQIVGVLAGLGIDRDE